MMGAPPHDGRAPQNPLLGREKPPQPPELRSIGIAKCRKSICEKPGIWGTIGKVQRDALLARRHRFQSSVGPHVANGSKCMGVPARTAVLSRGITLKNKLLRLGQGVGNLKSACADSGDFLGKCCGTVRGRGIRPRNPTPEGGLKAPPPPPPPKAGGRRRPLWKLHQTSIYGPGKLLRPRAVTHRVA